MLNFMTERRQLKAQIKYALANLGAENAHHDFEHVCRNFSRLRLGLNIMPATGPVSSGGDQGRDFETYEVVSSSGPDPGGSQKIIWKKAAFSCTIQKEDVPSKIKTDVAAIATKGSPVELVYFFSVQDISVGKRHELQNWAFDTYSLRLEVFDGEALSEEFMDNELFWIAEEYLHIPANLFPPVDDEEYSQFKEKWESKSPEVPNYGDLGEVRGLARQAFSNKELRQDLPLWLNKLREFSEIELASPVFKRKVLYELIALRMRGMHDLRGWEQFIRAYFDLSDVFNGPSEAKEASTAWIYSFGATQEGVADLSGDELIAWRRRIYDYCEIELGRTKSQSDIITLLELKGHLLLTDPYQRDIDQGLDLWHQVVSMIEAAPLFPLEAFSDVLTTLVPFLGGNAKFNELTEKTDDLLAVRVGSFAVADKCRDRALEYKNKGDLIGALREFHRAKINWFAKEALYGSLLSMLLIAEVYREFGLLYAAKYYAMAVVYVAQRAEDDRIKPFVARGLISLAEFEYLNGEWAHFVEHADLAMNSLGLYSPDLDDPVSEEVWKRTLFYTGTVYAITKAMKQDGLAQFTRDRIDHWESEELETLLPVAEQRWSSHDPGSLVTELAEKFHGLPFSDTEGRRDCYYTACGIRWRFSWDSSLLNDATAEHFISIIQIVLGELAAKDIYLLNSDVDVAIEFSSSFHSEQKPSERPVSWVVSLPSSPIGDKESAMEHHQWLLSNATALLISMSLLPSDRVEREIEELFKQGLTSKALSGNTYAVVFRDINDEGLYEQISNLQSIEPLKSVAPTIKGHEALAWKTGLLAEYDEAEEVEKVKNRYDRSIIPIRLTLVKLKESDQFKETVRNLRADGWKNWHILLAMLQVASNYRVRKIGYKNFEEMRGLFEKEVNREESSASIPVPLSEFSEKEIRMALELTLPSTLMHFGLELRTNPMDAKAVFDFLGHRTKYWEIDVEQEEYLPAT